MELDEALKVWAREKYDLAEDQWVEVEIEMEPGSMGYSEWTPGTSPSVEVTVRWKPPQEPCAECGAAHRDTWRDQVLTEDQEMGAFLREVLDAVARD